MVLSSDRRSHLFYIMIQPLFHNLNILVVDDEVSTIISVAFVLRHCGHTVDTASDGEEALSKLKDNVCQYQIIITDHLMMNVSGPELVEQLRVIRYPGKIVVLSSNLTRDVKDLYTKLGADRLIGKPFDLSELRQTVQELGACLHYS